MAKRKGWKGSRAKEEPVEARVARSIAKANASVDKPMLDDDPEGYERFARGEGVYARY